MSNDTKKLQARKDTLEQQLQARREIQHSIKQWDTNEKVRDVDMASLILSTMREYLSAEEVKDDEETQAGTSNTQLLNVIHRTYQRLSNPLVTGVAQDGARSIIHSTVKELGDALEKTLPYQRVGR